jgi:hypothetical protein
VFGELGNTYLDALNKLSVECLRKRYKFTDNDEFRRIVTTNGRGAQLYWREILFRSHLAAATSVLRGRRWIDGVATAVKTGNLLAFASTLRGLMESAADTSTTFITVPATLARLHTQINSALVQRKTVPSISTELEDILIHYSHARKIKQGENAPASHRTKQVREYLDVLKRAAGDRVVECYAELCDLTHAGASSVSMWLAGESELEIGIDPHREGQLLAEMLNRHEPVFADLFMFAFNGPLVTLAVLNFFSVPEVHTPELRAWDFSGIPAWKKIQSDLFGASKN